MKPFIEVYEESAFCKPGHKPTIFRYTRNVPRWFARMLVRILRRIGTEPETGGQA